jgi:hypothetical protein
LELTAEEEAEAEEESEHSEEWLNAFSMKLKRLQRGSLQQEQKRRRGRQHMFC